MVEYILFAVILFVSFGAGYKIHAIRTNNYKQRWLEALKLMDELRANGEIEKKVVIETIPFKEPNPLSQAEGDKKIIKQLHSLPGYRRRDAEANRLRSGLNPIDDLSGLPSYVLEEMISKRMRYGYDEIGRKFK